MRRLFGWCIVLVVLVGLPLIHAACAKDAEAVDVVNGVRPAHTAFRDIHIFANELAALPKEERAARLKEAKPRLEIGVVHFLRGMGRIPQNAEAEKVEFLFGSLDHVRANDGEGVEHKGYFKDQLVARVHIKDQKDPIDVLVQCLNGVFILPGDWQKLQSLGEAVPQERFTISRREGLVHHVDYQVAIDLAEYFDLPLYRGRTQTDRHSISPTEARRLESETDRVQVTVHVEDGDRFDLVAMTYNGRPGRRR